MPSEGIIAASADHPDPRTRSPGQREGAWNPTLANRWALLLVAPLAIVLVGRVAYPLAKLTIDSLTTGGGLNNYAAVFESSAGRRALITTLLAGVLVSFAAADRRKCTPSVKLSASSDHRSLNSSLLKSITRSRFVPMRTNMVAYVVNASCLGRYSSSAMGGIMNTIGTSRACNSVIRPR